MKKVLLSADGDVCVYAVPDAVADDLSEWGDRFRQWMRTAPEAARYRLMLSGGEVCLAFNERDFVQYLNEFAFPDQPSALVAELGCIDPQDCPEPLRDAPWYNF